MYLSVCNYKNEWEPFSALFYETGHSQAKKRKIISTKFFLLYDLIHIHMESLLYLQKHTCQTQSSLNREKYKNCFLHIGRNAYK